MAFEEAGIDTKFEALSVGDKDGQAFLVPLDESGIQTAKLILDAIAAYNHDRNCELVTNVCLSCGDDRTKGSLFFQGKTFCNEYCCNSWLSCMSLADKLQFLSTAIFGE